MSKKTFYILSLTWGFPMTIIGLVIASALTLCGVTPTRWGTCWHFSIGEDWGGISFGPVMITQHMVGTYLKDHELGHAIQNCYLGFLMPIVVVLPSVIRYWYRFVREKMGNPCKTDYYSIWFEKNASDIGRKYAFGWGLIELPF